MSPSPPVIPPAPGHLAMIGRQLDYWVTVYKRTWKGSAISSFVMPLFYVVALGVLLGGFVDPGQAHLEGASSYLAFVAPGLLAAQAMQTAIAESTWSVMGAIKWQRQYHAMLATPLTVGQVLVGHLSYVTMRVTVTSAVFLTVAALLGTLGSAWVLLALPAAVLTGLAFATVIFAFAAGQDTDQGFNVLFRFVITPMFLFSGTFFPVEQLPGWLHPVAYATPLWHGVELCRSLSVGTVELGSAAGHVGYLLLWVLVGALVAHRCFTRRLID